MFIFHYLTHFLLLLVYSSGFMEFTSEVSVWPNTFPYPDCSGMGCGVTLV
jgi:hypothetical protein